MRRTALMALGTSSYSLALKQIFEWRVSPYV